MIVPRTSRHSVVATSAGGLAISASVRSHTVVTDQPVRAGGNDSAPTPLDLLGVSLSSCIALHVLQFCQAERLEADGLAVEVKPVWRGDPGRIARFDVVLHLPEAIPASYRPGIGDVVRACPVFQTLVHAAEVEYTDVATTASAPAI